jgi:hypothetical protein
MKKILSIFWMMALAVSAFSQNGFRGVETDTNNWFINRPTNAWAKWESDTNAVKFVRDVQNNGGVGGGTGISTNGGSGINNTFTNATLAGQPMLPGWGSLSNPTGALLGVGSDGTFRVSPNLGWSVIGLTGNIDTNSSDGIITNDTRALTFTNSANKFGGFSITTTSTGTFSNLVGDVSTTTNHYNGSLTGVNTNTPLSYWQVINAILANTAAANQFAGASTNTPTAGYAAIWTGLINANGSYSLSSVAFSPSLVNLGNVVNIAQVTNTETGLSLGGTWTGSLVGNASSASTASAGWPTTLWATNTPAGMAAAGANTNATGFYQPATTAGTNVGNYNSGSQTNIPFARNLSSTNGVWTPTVDSTGATNWVFSLTNTPASTVNGVLANGNLPTVGTAGTYAKVLVDQYGRVTNSTTLALSDLPSGYNALTNIITNGIAATPGEVVTLKSDGTLTLSNAVSGSAGTTTNTVMLFVAPMDSVNSTLTTGSSYVSPGSAVVNTFEVIARMTMQTNVTITSIDEEIYITGAPLFSTTNIYLFPCTNGVNDAAFASEVIGLGNLATNYHTNNVSNGALHLVTGETLSMCFSNSGASTTPNIRKGYIISGTIP